MTLARLMVRMWTAAIVRVILDKRGPDGLGPPAIADRQQRGEFVRLRQFIGGLQKSPGRFELKHLPGAVRPNCLQLDALCGRRRGRFAFAIAEVKAKARRHFGLKHTQFHLPKSSLQESSSVGSGSYV